MTTAIRVSCWFTRITPAKMSHAKISGAILIIEKFLEVTSTFLNENSDLEQSPNQDCKTVMEVDIENFYANPNDPTKKTALKQFSEELFDENTQFASFDFEMTGIRNSQSKEMLSNTEDYYQRFRNSAQNFSPLQCGICLWKYVSQEGSPSTNNMANQIKYTSKVFSFLLFDSPRFVDVWSHSFTIIPSSIFFSFSS